MNAEQIIDELHEAELSAPGANESPSYYYGFRDGAEALLKRLRLTGLDLDHTYEHPDLGIGRHWTAFAHWAENGEERTKVIGAELFVRRGLEAR